MNRVHVYIDGDNLHYLQKDLGWKMDFLKLLNLFEGLGDVMGVYYYTNEFDEDRKKSGKAAFLNHLTQMGILVKTRLNREIDGDPKFLKCPHCAGMIREEGKFWKSDIDLKLAVDMSLNLGQYDTVVVVSGDGDFQCLVQDVAARGKRVYVAHAKHFVSNHLLKVIVGQDFIDLSTMKGDLLLERRYGGQKDDEVFERDSAGGRCNQENCEHCDEAHIGKDEDSARRDGSAPVEGNSDNKNQNEASERSVEPENTTEMSNRS